MSLQCVSKEAITLGGLSTPTILLDGKEYVASLIGLYKNSGAVLYVGNFFLII